MVVVSNYSNNVFDVEENTEILRTVLHKLNLYEDSVMFPVFVLFLCLVFRFPTALVLVLVIRAVRHILLYKVSILQKFLNFLVTQFT